MLAFDITRDVLAAIGTLVIVIIVVNEIGWWRFRARVRRLVNRRPPC